MLKLWGGIAVLAVLVIVGFGVLVSLEMDRLEEKAEENSITLAQFREVELGLSEEQLRSTLKVETEVEEKELWTSNRGGREIEVLCLYYNRSGDWSSMFRFCFDDGKLNSKDNW